MVQKYNGKQCHTCIAHTHCLVKMPKMWSYSYQAGDIKYNKSDKKINAHPGKMTSSYGTHLAKIAVPLHTIMMQTISITAQSTTIAVQRKFVLKNLQNNDNPSQLHLQIKQLLLLGLPMTI